MWVSQFQLSLLLARQIQIQSKLATRPNSLLHQTEEQECTVMPGQELAQELVPGQPKLAPKLFQQLKLKQ
jgi:hypothetical protein